MPRLTAPILVATAAAGCLGLALLGPAASADSHCQGGGTTLVPGVLSVNPSFTDSNSPSGSGVQACESAGGSGTLTAFVNPDQNNPTGYVVTDGANDNMGAGAGYIGAERASDGTVAVVGSSDPVDYDSGDAMGEPNEGMPGDKDDTQPTGYGDAGHDHHQVAGVGHCPSGTENSGTVMCPAGDFGPFINP